jgi:hypothetical protein
MGNAKQQKHKTTTNRAKEKKNPMPDEGRTSTFCFFG